MAIQPFRPMLAVDFDPRQLRFPYYASPKLDGIRCIAMNGEPMTRTMKRVPNFSVREFFSQHRDVLEGLDGELIVGDPTAADCYRQTSSGVMAHGGSPDFRFFVFDVVDPTGQRPFIDRWRECGARSMTWPKNVGVLLNEPLEHARALQFFEDKMLQAGYEGAMLRRPDSRYKQGRATLSENSLLKVKRWRDGEAIITGVEEQMHNANPAMRNELGRTKRSSARAGLIGKGTLGALVVRGQVGQPFAGVQFSIGTGMDDELRAAMWKQRENLTGLVVKYKFFDFGAKDAPRHPVFVGFRKEGA